MMMIAYKIPSLAIRRKALKHLLGLNASLMMLSLKSEDVDG